MRNFIRAALVIGTLSTPMIALADAPAKPDTTKKDTKATDAKKTDTKATDKKTDAKKTDAKATDKKDDKAAAKPTEKK